MHARSIMVVLAPALIASCGGEDRVGAARANVTDALLKRAAELGSSKLPKDLFLRAFKTAGELEVWARFKPGAPYQLFKTYAIAAQSGGPGPKRKEGDRQVPEGFYRIEALNPKSSYHLSLRVDYPNASDRKRSDPKQPGSDIYIHGRRVSIGCLAMTDPIIEELYVLVAEGWPKRVDVHIFPARLDPANLKLLQKAHPAHADFWAEIAPGYAAFESTKRPPKVTVDRTGRYQITAVR